MTASARSVVSLCSGIGGIELGLESLGIGPVVAQVEKDEYCCGILAKHWPSATRVADLFDAGAHNLPVDPFVVAAGFPCQPVSLAGKGRAQDDARWLWPEVARVVRELRPRYVFLENVPGLLTANGGRAFGDVLRDLAALGVSAEWDRFRACDVGAPHRRERWFLLGVLADDWRLGREQSPSAQTWEPLSPGGDPRRLADAGCVDGDGWAHRVEGGRSHGFATGWDEGANHAERCGRGSLGDAHVEGLPLDAVQPGDAGEEQQAALGAGRRGNRAAVGLAQPGMGRDAHGLRGRVDIAPRWPAGRGEAQRPDEPPRTASKVSNRRDRLTALGNAVVPQVAALAWCVLWERLTGRGWKPA